MMSLFKTEKGKEEILDLYDQKLQELKVGYDYVKVETTFGETNIIATGPPSGPPLLLIHGSNGCAPIALETYPNLSKNFRVYAIDVLAQPNRSAETRMSMKGDSYGRWINELITFLKIENVTMVGFSFGGLIILKTLEFDESKVKTAYLSSPAYVVNGNPFQSLIKIFIPMKMYMITEKIKYVEKFLSAAFTDRDEFAINYLSKVFMHFKMDFTPVPTIGASQAGKVETPISIFAADHDIFFPGSKMLKRASRIFPSLKSVKLFKNSKHVLSTEKNRFIEEIIIQDGAQLF